MFSIEVTVQYLGFHLVYNGLVENNIPKILYAEIFDFEI